MDQAVVMPQPEEMEQGVAPSAARMRAVRRKDSRMSERKPGRGVPLITPLGLVAGDVLLYLERRGTSTLRQLVRGVKWPVRMVMMGVGSLIRDGLVLATQNDVEVIVEPRRTR